jgi:dTMP kinase
VSVGRFVALEGPKGVGKTALCTALAARLSPRERMQSLLTKEPTPAFDLQNEQMLRGAALAEAIAADRRVHVAEELAPALAAGKLVVCDRYLLSSYVFHTGDGVPSSVITELNRSFPLPSLNIILHADEGTIRRRLGLRGGATRLQSADSSAEFAQYIRFAKLMELQGIAYEVCDNANQEAQQAIVERLLRLLRADDWSA